MMLLDMPPAQRCRVRLAIALCQLGGYLDRTGQPPPIGSLGVVVGDAVIAARPRRLGSQLAWVIACAEGGERGWDLRPADSVAMVPLEFSCDAGPPQGKDPHLSTDGCGHLNQPNPHAPALVAADLFRKLGLTVEIVASDWGNLVIRRASKKPIEEGGWNVFGTSWGGADMLDPGLNQSLRTNGDAAWFGWPKDEKLEALRS